MAEKKTGKADKAKSAKNYHKGTFIVRFPEEFRERVTALAAANRRTIAGQAQVLLEAALAALSPASTEPDPPKTRRTDR